MMMIFVRCKYPELFLCFTLTCLMNSADDQDEEIVKLHMPG